jgi:uncharacterized cysteine cluster protein YcgN (CxxCxxCC family)
MTWDIVKEIKSCARDYELHTGFKPKRVYLGRDEVKQLRDWALENADCLYAEVAEGKNRPEVHGMYVYEVNDDNPHMRCSV